MELPLLLQLYAWNCYGSLAIGLAMNFLLLFVAKKCPSSYLREYRRVVFYFSFMNILFLIVQALNQTVKFLKFNICIDKIYSNFQLILNASNNFMYMMLSGPIAQIPSFAVLITMDIAYFILVNQIMAGLAMQFVERYLVICRCFFR
jgi:hypothetical protein